VHKYSKACPILVDVRKNILVTLQFFAFLHSQGQKQTCALQKAMSALPLKGDLCDALAHFRALMAWQRVIKL
jgi:hypothetical protein